MKTRLGIVIATALMIACVCGAELQKWQYRIVDLNPHSVQAQMDSLGENGWELVAQLKSGELIFKRPFQTNAPPEFDASTWLSNAEFVKSEKFGQSNPVEFVYTKAGPAVWTRESDWERPQFKELYQAFLIPGIDRVPVFALDEKGKATRRRIGEITRNK